MGRVLVAPLSTAETLERIAGAVRAVGAACWSEPAVACRAVMRKLDEVLRRLAPEDRVTSVFTSKTAAEILARALERYPSLPAALLSRVVAIGPYTALKVRELAGRLGVDPVVAVPEKHSSEGLIELLEREERCIIWCSSRPSRELRAYAEGRGFPLVPLYTHVINVKAVRRLASEARRYETRYYVFTSCTSVRAWRAMLRAGYAPSPGSDRAVVLSQRVASEVPSDHFGEVRVYGRSDVSGFADFVAEVVMAP